MDPLTTTKISDTTQQWDIDAIRRDFPTLNQSVNGHELAYFDNAATAQKPQTVIDAIRDYYQQDNANVHRGIHTLSERASYTYEQSRSAVQKFINARAVEEIIFTKGTTEAINLVAQSYGRKILKPGDEVLISQMEHHANIVPWQVLCQQTGAVLKVVPLLSDGSLDMTTLEHMLCDKTKIVAMTQTSNVTGAINPIEQIIKMAHAYQAVVLVDGAQSIVHEQIDVQALDCDFFAFSAHKLYGPTGIGILYGKQEILDAMLPYQFGGNMIEHVSFDNTTYAELPAKFEAGTPNIAGAVGLLAAINYLNKQNLNAAFSHEQTLLSKALTACSTIDGMAILAQPTLQAPVFSFVMDSIHAHDLAHILDQYGIAIRTGHHCAMPLMASLGVSSTARVSFAFYNTEAEIDRLINALKHAQEFFQ